MIAHCINKNEVTKLNFLREEEVPRLIRQLLDYYGELTTREVINHIEEVYELTDADLEIIKTRNDERYAQTIRNVALHKKGILEKEGEFIFPEGVTLTMDDSKGRDKYKYNLATINSENEKVKSIDRNEAENRKSRRKTFTARKIDFEDLRIKKSLLGKAGEDFVLKNEIDKLEKLGLSPGMVYHTSKIEGDGAGYDIASVNEKKEIIYIEVKTTSGKKETPFYISQNEKTFFEIYKENAYLYRVYNFNMDKKVGEIEIYMAEEILNSFQFDPVGYKVKK